MFLKKLSHGVHCDNSLRTLREKKELIQKKLPQFVASKILTHD